MSDLFEKFREIKYLPIFPLPVLLLPGELLPLHIFEPRYRQMLKDIALTDNLFGLSYHNQASESFALPATQSYGCIAEVREIVALEDGRSNILTVGTVRYLLEEITESDTPYLYGKISVFDDYEEDKKVLQPLADEVFSMFTRAARIAYNISNSAANFPEIPQAEPQSLSFLVAAALNLSPEVKYEFARTRSTVERLKGLRSLLKKTLAKLDESAKINKIAKTNGHGNTKIR